MNYVIGVDEVGRGPLAGPVTLGILAADKKMEQWILKNIFNNKLRDSKKLKPKEREEIFKTLNKLGKENKIIFKVIHSSNKIIDKVGISKTIKSCIDRGLKDFNKNNEVRLDGLLKAPKEFKNQKTIIKGDEKDVFIACASIMAKVSRDKLMCRIAQKYPKYSFELHKGYGTALHLSILKKYGLSPLHRHSFCKNIE